MARGGGGHDGCAALIYQILHLLPVLPPGRRRGKEREREREGERETGEREIQREGEERERRWRT